VETRQAAKPVNNKPQSSAPINKEAKKELQKWQREFQQLEEQIAKLNARKNELEASLSDPGTYSDKNKFLETENAYKKAQNELTQLNSRYEIVFEKIMALESKN
jgi:ATP-binding cassette subfamily F protein 3